MSVARGWFSNNHGPIGAAVGIIGLGFTAWGTFKDDIQHEYRSWKGEPAVVEATQPPPTRVSTGFVLKDTGATARPPSARGSGATTTRTSRTAVPRNSWAATTVAAPVAAQPSSPSHQATLAEYQPRPSTLVEAPAENPAPASRSISKGTEISVQPSTEVCDAELRRGAAISARLKKELIASDGSKIPEGTPVRVEVVERRVASGDQDPVISLEATSITTATGSSAIETRMLHFALEKPGMMGTVVKGTVIGAVGGAAIGLVLRKDVGKAALIGAVAGGAIGAVKAAGAQACIAPSSTFLPFTLVQAVEVH